VGLLPEVWEGEGQVRREDIDEDEVDTLRKFIANSAIALKDALEDLERPEDRARGEGIVAGVMLAMRAMGKDRSA
jgi:hypothetical protein